MEKLRIPSPIPLSDDEGSPRRPSYPPDVLGEAGEGADINPDDQGEGDDAAGFSPEEDHEESSREGKIQFNSIQFYLSVKS